MKYKNQHSPSTSGGFALVIALSLMAFVLLLLLSITTLVQVEQAGAGISTSKLEAKQAALLSLNMAIGKLQETAGLDQRVTAPAEVVDDTNPKQLTGVWRSWEGKDHQSNGLPKAPDYTSKLDTGELDIDSTDTGRFLSWLVSSAYDPDNDAFEAEADSPPSLIEDSATVPLVASGSVGTNTADEVHLEPTEVNGGESAIAWWISGENTKALLRTKEDPDDTLGWKDRLTSSTKADSSVFGMTDSDELENLDRVTGRNDYNLVSDAVVGGNSVSEQYFHDVTGYARGLLTNTANGGWRRDLSLMSEQWNALQNPGGGSSDFPFFTLSPGVETKALKNSGAVGGLIYPWAAESSFKAAASGHTSTRSGGASVGWGALVDFAKQYQQIVSGSSTGNITFAQKLVNGRDEINRASSLARMHWVLSFKSVDSGTTGGTDGTETLYNAILNSDLVLTYWNPYNVSLAPNPSAGNVQFISNTQFPYDFKFSLTSGEQDDFYPIEHTLITNNKNLLIYNMPAEVEAWKPGESRVYSIVGRQSGHIFKMGLGYDSYLGLDRNVKNKRNGDNLAGVASDEFTVELQAPASGAFSFSLFERYRSNQLNLQYDIDYTDGERYWPDPIVINDTQTLGALASKDPSPFMIVMLQSPNITESLVSGRGYSQKKPSLGFAGQQTIKSVDALPYDMVIKYPNGISGGGDEGLPVSVPSDNPEGSIGTSYRYDDGLNSLITSEIPTKPLRSLGELQHFDVGYYSPAAPFVANPIGNSSASHLIESNRVNLNDGFPEDQKAAYDHSYVANHLLFDDWFVSSIAPDTNGYSSYPGSEIRGIEKVYSEFLSGLTPLPNAAYRPAQLLSATDASEAANDLIPDYTAWHRVASELEVNGMFNINSTSVAAWTAMLRHLRDGDVPYVSNITGATSYQISSDAGNEDHPVARTSVAGDPKAHPDQPIYSAIGQHTRLTDTQIEALAIEIVEQVKARGPFLSLSEFMNRRLTTTDTDLALSGAVESALVDLSTRGASENPYSDFQGNLKNEDGSDAVVQAQSDVDDRFPVAAEGHKAYGFPGWVRQADVLRPLTPVLSARDDTFVIRAYGGVKDPITGETASSAWCEAVVQRRADYVDSEADDTAVLPSKSSLDSEANERFGRRFSIVSFRWLSPDEV